MQAYILGLVAHLVPEERQGVLRKLIVSELKGMKAMQQLIRTYLWWSVVWRLDVAHHNVDCMAVDVLAHHYVAYSVSR